MGSLSASCLTWLAATCVVSCWRKTPDWHAYRTLSKKYKNKNKTNQQKVPGWKQVAMFLHDNFVFHPRGKAETGPGCSFAERPVADVCCVHAQDLWLNGGQQRLLQNQNKVHSIHGSVFYIRLVHSWAPWPSPEWAKAKGIYWGSISLNINKKLNANP